MLLKRIIPILLLNEGSLVKTIKFGRYKYIGDPCNTVRIFNELEVDELIFLDIKATQKNKEPNYTILREIAEECFMPLTYGGAISKIEQAKKIFDTGFEKISINTAALKNPNLITKLSKEFGSQSIVCSIDLKESYWKDYKVFSKNAKSIAKKLKYMDWIKRVEELGAGEILLTSVDREGTWSGFDKSLIKKINKEVSIPVIFHGGASSNKDIIDLFQIHNLTAVGIGSLAVFQKKDMGVLINYPDESFITRF
tara:strand:+ start:23 stop:781 length:759 start_codon:yes stop_codon:yes gene_type:complete